jgi:hypothetical protein
MHKDGKSIDSYSQLGFVVDKVALGQERSALSY